MTAESPACTINSVSSVSATVPHLWSLKPFVVECLDHAGEPSEQLFQPSYIYTLFYYTVVNMQATFTREILLVKKLHALLLPLIFLMSSCIRGACYKHPTTTLIPSGLFPCGVWSDPTGPGQSSLSRCGISRHNVRCTSSWGCCW